jgi:hypothetical protein
VPGTTAARTIAIISLLAASTAATRAEDIDALFLGGFWCP